MAEVKVTPALPKKRGEVSVMTLAEAYGAFQGATPVGEYCAYMVCSEPADGKGYFVPSTIEELTAKPVTDWYGGCYVPESPRGIVRVKADLWGGPLSRIGKMDESYCFYWEWFSPGTGEGGEVRSPLYSGIDFDNGGAYIAVVKR